jgi:hypothetical protein
MERCALLGVLFGLLAGSCGGGTITVGTYTLSLTHFEPQNGNTVRLHVKSSSDATAVLAEASGTVANGQLTFVVPNVLETGKTYTVDFYADANGNGSYDPPTGNPPHFVDPSWRRTVEGNTAGENETFAYDEVWVDVSPFR